MTESQHQPDPQAEPTAQPETASPTSPEPVTRKKSQVRWIIAGAAVLVLLLCFGGCGVLLATTNGAESPDQGKAPSATASQSRSSTSGPTSAAAPTTAPATTAPPAPVYDTPTKGDFTLKVKTLRKQCFGSAGCNITYRIDVTYTGDGLDPSSTYEVTYEVKGAEDPIINTFEVTGDSASVQQEETASTKRSGDKLTAVVTDVSEL
ncbi:hypothetical protein [Micromonospora sp. WMMD1155]|uniref:hypothetical protein n=1 Tax=Micromonospora sp. WMMD1155 TaxID=3016094 RepID=UPI002499E1FE|nr:hypothetical protein [Micromonospora sp. WMMD1155]WFE53603.1 hypothetical protein O7617_26200 [Micromonospora sp. WMMD1155]